MKSTQIIKYKSEFQANNQYLEDKKTSIATPDNLTIPDIWTLSEKFLNDNNLIKYCTHYESFYIYDRIELIWKSCGKTDLQSILIKWVKKTYPKSYKNFKPRRLEDIILLLITETKFSLPLAKEEANKKGFLIPFKNGVLNSITKEFFKHDPSFYINHKLAIDYKPEANIQNTDMATFISQFVNFNTERLNLLRAMLYTTLTNDSQYQLGWYFYGPGCTGKSTLINMLLYLLGPDASVTTTMASLNTRFGLSKINHQNFMVISDMTHFKGKESNTIKLFIANDPLQVEAKYKNPVVIYPNITVAITSNSIWDIINPTGGITRRIVYFPYDYIPEIKKTNLFSLSQNGSAEGTLLSYLDGFVNWILACPSEILADLSAGGLVLNQNIKPGNLISTFHLNTWIESCLINEKESKTGIGFIKSSAEDTLYGCYLKWCSLNNIENPTKISRFSDLLLDNLKTLHWSNVSKKRTSRGFFITGVKLKEGWVNNLTILKPKFFQTENLEFKAI